MNPLGEKKTAGLWHGASWTFVAWGLYHGILLLLEKYPLKGILAKTPSPILHILTLLAVIVGGILIARKRCSSLLIFPRRFSILGGCSVPGAARFGIPPQNTILQQTGSFLYSAFLAAAHGFGRFTGISCFHGAVLALCFLRCF